MKIGKSRSKLRNQGRNPLPFRDLEDTRYYLFLIGKSPQLQLKDFFKSIRRNEERKMSYEYKIFKKLCPVYGNTGDPIINMLDPFRAYHNVEENKYLWTRAFVKLVVDQSIYEEYERAVEHDWNARQAYYSISEQSSPEEIGVKKAHYELKKMKNLKSLLPLIPGIKRIWGYALPFAAFWLICSANMNLRMH